MSLHAASLPSAGVMLSVLPFGTSRAPFFDGALGSVLTIPNDPKYSQPFANELTVAAWLCPLALNNANAVGGQDKYVHYVEKAVAESVDAEWALRFYNQLNKTRHSRLSFYTFNLGSPAREGNGSYMELGSRRTTRRRSSSGNGRSWLARPSLGFRRRTFRLAARFGNKASRRSAKLQIITATTAYTRSTDPARLRLADHKKPASKGQSRTWRSGTACSPATKSPRSGAPA
jgi:hypothetical protein